MFELGNFRLNPASGVLTHDSRPTGLGPRGVAVLAALVERADEYVSKAHLLDAAWPNTVVEEGNLPVQIAAIRRVLAAHGAEHWIETLPRRGYRFVGPVKKLTSVPPATPGHRSNLPAARSSFIGRERELVEVKRLLPGKRLITIVGVGGMGKTRLALQVAAEVVDAYRDGVWLAELASIREPGLVPTALAQAIGITERSGESAIDSLLAHVRSRQILILLDNCEHLIDACAGLLDVVLREAKEATVLATSREPLRLSGEQTYVLQSLGLPNADSIDAIRGSEAVQLFVERVRQQLPQFELTRDRGRAVAEVCMHLDGIPLALELAAARARSLSIEQINERLTDRFRLLTDGARTAVPRQQTLRATLDWSYDLLSEDERVVLRRLSIFPDSFTVDAGVAAASDDRVDGDAVVDLIAQLVSRSLVIADTSGAGTRYRLLETVRAYALEKLDATGEGDERRRRHARFFRDMFERESDDSLRMPNPVWRSTYLAEIANVRAALDWLEVSDRDNATFTDLAGAAGPLWTTLGLFGEGVRRVRAAIDRIGLQTREVAQARLWLWLGRLLDETPAQALPALERAVALYRRERDSIALGLALMRLGRVLALMGRYDASEAALEEGRPLVEGAGPCALDFYHFNSGFLKNMMGDPEAAQLHYKRALELARESRDELAAMATMGNLANVTWGLGDLDSAAKSLRELVVMLRSSPASTRRLLGFALMNLAELLVAKDGRESLALAREGLPMVKADGSAWLFSDYGALRAVSEGRFAKAALLAGYADSAHAANGGMRSFVTERARKAMRRLLSETLHPDELDRLLKEGADLSEERACRLALED